MRKLNMLMIATLVLLILPLQVAAQTVEQPNQNGSQQSGSAPSKGHGPPPEAYTACEGKSAGETSELLTPDGETLTGPCEADRDGRLVLRPENNKKGNPQRPQPKT